MDTSIFDKLTQPYVPGAGPAPTVDQKRAVLEMGIASMAESARKSLLAYQSLVAENGAIANGATGDVRLTALQRIWKAKDQMAGLRAEFTARALAWYGVQYPYQLGQDWAANAVRKVRAEIDEAEAVANRLLVAQNYFGRDDHTNPDVSVADVLDTVKEEVKPDPETNVTMRTVAMAAAVVAVSYLVWRLSR